MKNRLIILLLSAVTVFSSCDMFLEMPEVVGNVGLEDVFTNKKDAEGILWRAYHRTLRDGLPEGWGINHGTLAGLSGELTRGYSWHAGYSLVVNGPSPELDSYGMPQGSPCNYEEGWQAIRASFLFMQNVDMCDEISDEMKEMMKGEAYGLVAYRYMGMLYRWGGVPIVRKANSLDEDLNFKRATVDETVKYILELCDEAYNRLPDSWVDIEPGSGDKWVGRLTKGVALAIKARTLTFAARPLFNSNTAYCDEFGLKYKEEDKPLIWLGGYDEQRYRDAIQAHLDLIEWGKKNGKHLIFTAGEGNRNSYEDAIKDYGRGVSQLNGPETILSFKVESDQQIYNNMTEGYNWSAYVGAGERAQRGVLTNFVRLYRDVDGNPIDWPVVGEAEPRPIADFAANIDKIEPRFRVDICVPGKYGRSNDGDANWGQNISYMGSFTTDVEQAAQMVRATEGRGIGVPTKFYFEAGARRWFEFPLFRLAENYLHLAEAYNEIGETDNALKYLNIIRNRAGMPSSTTRDKAALREEIQHEKFLEYFEENHRYYDSKHWKRADIGTEVLGGDKTEISFLRQGSTNTMEDLVSYWDAYSYTAYWHPKWFLEPFLQIEVNKGLIVQNPGY